MTDTPIFFQADLGLLWALFGLAIRISYDLSAAGLVLLSCNNSHKCKKFVAYDQYMLCKYPVEFPKTSENWDTIK